MKTIIISIDRIRSLIRWTTGLAFTVGIIGGSCFLFPALTGDMAALSLTSFLALIIGLKVALPPINPHDDWVAFGLGRQRKSLDTDRRVTRTTKQEEPPEPVPAPRPSRIGMSAVPVNRLEGLIRQASHHYHHPGRHSYISPQHGYRMSHLRRIHRLGIGKAHHKRTMGHN